jgi:hypothetical protein
MRELWSRFGGYWCKTIHSSPMWPAHGRYQCRQCFRSHPVPWEQQPPATSHLRWRNEQDAVDPRAKGFLKVWRWFGVFTAPAQQ